jgi:1-acyl-sn-glycerol-3-phosphate acyltransferase
MDYVKWLFLCGEIVVVHPEGTRIKGKIGQIKTEYVNLTKELWEKYELAIPIIPVGIEYENMGVPRSRVYLRAGTSLDVRKDNLAELVRVELAALSNLPYPGN